jgi:hypothetical protein
MSSGCAHGPQEHPGLAKTGAVDFETDDDWSETLVLPGFFDRVKADEDASGVVSAAAEEAEDEKFLVAGRTDPPAGLFASGTPRSLPRAREVPTMPRRQFEVIDVVAYCDIGVSAGRSRWWVQVWALQDAVDERRSL